MTFVWTIVSLPNKVFKFFQNTLSLSFLDFDDSFIEELNQDCREIEEKFEQFSEIIDNREIFPRDEDGEVAELKLNVSFDPIYQELGNLNKVTILDSKELANLSAFVHENFSKTMEEFHEIFLDRFVESHHYFLLNLFRSFETILEKKEHVDFELSSVGLLNLFSILIKLHDVMYSDKADEGDREERKEDKLFSKRSSNTYPFYKHLNSLLEEKLKKKISHLNVCNNPRAIDENLDKEAFDLYIKSLQKQIIDLQDIKKTGVLTIFNNHLKKLDKHYSPVSDLNKHKNDTFYNTNSILILYLQNTLPNFYKKELILPLFGRPSQNFYKK